MGTGAVLLGAAEQNNKRIVMALQSGLKGELTWALNTLTMLSFKEKDTENRKDSSPLARIPGLLDALLHVVPSNNPLLSPSVQALHSFSNLVVARYFSQ